MELESSRLSLENSWKGSIMEICLPWWVALILIQIYNMSEKWVTNNTDIHFIHGS